MDPMQPQAQSDLHTDEQQQTIDQIGAELDRATQCGVHRDGRSSETDGAETACTREASSRPSK